jgi:two-component system, cell cycle response regulator DivK
VSGWWWSGRRRRRPGDPAQPRQRSCTVAPANAEPEGELKTVLIVDDSPEVRDVYATALEDCGYRAVQAPDGAAAIRLATDHAPDLILMNITVPLVNGADAIEILKSHPATEEVPILVISGHTSPTIRETAWQAGCDDFLNKPLQPKQLIAAVSERIGAAS